jgi:hypothetical protein
MGKATQTGDVLQHLIRYGSITSYEAFKRYGCTRLSARIYCYRKMGYDIVTRQETVKNRYENTTTYARYILKAMPEQKGE